MLVEESNIDEGVNESLRGLVVMTPVRENGGLLKKAIFLPSKVFFSLSGLLLVLNALLGFSFKPATRGNCLLKLVNLLVYNQQDAY